MKTTLHTLLRSIAVVWLLVTLAPHANADQKSFLWKITSKQNVVYMLGSVHVGNSALYPLNKTIEDAFTQSSVLAVEMDGTNEQAMMATMTTALYAPPDNIKNHLPQDLIERMQKILPKYSLPIEAIQTMKPYMAAMVLTLSESARLGYSAEYGLDLHFLGRAKADQKKIIELESADSQIRMMDEMTGTEQTAMLKHTIVSIEKNNIGDELKAMFSAWKQGDPVQLATIANASLDEVPELKDVFNERMIISRNKAMTEKIAAFLKNKETYFVVVGAMHLTGEQGIINLLRKKDFQVKQL